MASPREKDRWGFLPTVEEVHANKPDACGWKTGMENCALSGGIYLAGMVYRYETTSRPEHAADARRIYEGLRLLATVPKSKGFIARGLLPDGKTYYINSSVDQYTLYVFGIWTYYHSSIATEKEKTEIQPYHTLYRLTGRSREGEIVQPYKGVTVYLRLRQNTNVRRPVFGSGLLAGRQAGNIQIHRALTL